jgi:hypothetical protein
MIVSAKRIRNIILKTLAKVLPVYPSADYWFKNRINQINPSNHYAALFQQEKMGCLKWNEYSTIYDELFQNYIHRQNLRILEIGVLEGGSQRILRQYFHESSIIFGVDINPKCLELDTGTKIRIGDATEEKFLSEVVSEMGGVDVVIDDGSHLSSQQKKSFEVLFPLLSDGGLYVVEDLEHSYLLESKGLPFLPNTFWNMSKSTTELLNNEFRRYRKKSALNIDASELLSVKFFPQIIAFSKGKRSTPRIVVNDNYIPH